MFYGGPLPLATDDDLWVAKPPIEEIFALFYDPVCWVRNFVKVTKVGLGAVPASMLPNYSISFEAVTEPAGCDPSRFWLQGIDGTNILTVRMPSDGALYYVYHTLLGPLPDERPCPYLPCTPRCANPAYLAYLAQDFIHQKLAGKAPNLKNAACALFHGRKIQVTVAEQSKAYAHMRLVDAQPAMLQLSKNPADCVQVSNRIVVAIYHLLAAAWPNLIEDSFNACDKDNSTVCWQTWDGQQWQVGPNGPIDLGSCFQCKPGGSQPLTITGYGSSDVDPQKEHKRIQNLLDLLDPTGKFSLEAAATKSTKKAKAGDVCPAPPEGASVAEATLAPAASSEAVPAGGPGPSPGPSPSPGPGNEATCEVLVAEYDAGTGGVTWTDAFSKTYTGG